MSRHATPQRRPKGSIRWILPAAVVTPVICVAVVLTLLAYHTGVRSANELAAQSAGHIHEGIENHLNHLMELPPAIDRLNRSRLDAGILDLNDPQRSCKIVFQTLQSFPAVSSIVLGSASGQVMWVIRYPGETSYEYAIKATPQSQMQEFAMSPDGQVGLSPLRAYSFDTVMRPWYRSAIKAQRPTWGDVYIWIRGGKGVTLGIPYVEPYRDPRGNIVGVINCELTLSDISAFLRKLKVGKTGVAFIVDDDGNLIATSANLECMKDGNERLRASEAPDARIAAAAAKLASGAAADDATGAPRVEKVEFDRHPAQMVVSSYRNGANLDWKIVTVVPDADFLAGVERGRRQSLLIGLAAILVALGVGVGLAVWLLRPILAVVRHVRRVGEGALDARIDRTDNREIAELCHAINDMTVGLQDRVQLRHALNLAMEVQQSLLPQNTPSVPGLDIAARSRYCDQTGGDYYDYLDVEGVGPDSLMIALGDVTGHGIAAAMLMATARGVLRSQVRMPGSLGTLLTRVNEHLVADTNGTRFMTMFLAVVDPRNMTMRWASAGHDQPLIYDPQNGVLGDLDPAGGGLPLGVSPSEVYEELTYDQLRPGQVMLIGTDGLWESRNAQNECFGKARVTRAIAASAHLSAAEIEAAVDAELRAFCTGRSSDDDITYVVVKFAANPALTTPVPVSAE